jgi:ribulose-5-phosphate 4-epimerase/fuculose-1-phosphate aldolase
MLKLHKQSNSIAEEEWRLRCQLTEFYHLVDYLGWSEMIFNHISVRIPGPEHHYLVNPFGLNYSEITPENLLKVGVDGKLVEPSEYPANPAGFALHGALHSHREDIICVAHTHTTAISAVCMKRGGFEHNNFYAAQLYGRIAYHEFEGITVHQDERSRMVASIGDKHVLVLRNHGIAVCERDIPTTFMLLWTVQRAAEIQCQSAVLKGDDIQLSETVLQKCMDSSTDLIAHANFAKLLFDATVRRMNKERGVTAH